MNLEKALNKLNKIKAPKGFVSCINFNKEHYYYDKDSDSKKFALVHKGKVSKTTYYTLSEFMRLTENQNVGIVTIKVNPY